MPHDVCIKPHALQYIKRKKQQHDQRNTNTTATATTTTTTTTNDNNDNSNEHIHNSSQGWASRISGSRSRSGPEKIDVYHSIPKKIYAYNNMRIL